MIGLREISIFLCFYCVHLRVHGVWGHLGVLLGSPARLLLVRSRRAMS